MNEIFYCRSPKDKAIVILNFINHISTKYKIIEKTQLIKLAVYAILKSNVNSFKENLKFIQLFRHKTIITSEEDYYLSIMNQSVEFIENMNSNLLKINRNEFLEKCEDFEKKEVLKGNKSMV